MIKTLLYSLLAALLLPLLAVADSDFNEHRAKFNYQMFCQGCHTPTGEGHKSVPQLKGFLGHFLATQQGREYLIRVPGSANSVLNDENLAEVLNWMLITFAEDSIPENWNHLQAKEVSHHRKDPLLEVVDYRKQLVKTLAIKGNESN